MKKKEIEKLTKRIVKPIINSNNLELVDLEYVKEGSNKFLRIFINKPSGVSIDDCQEISRKVSKQLDEIDPIQENYFLEVSSPGIDRPFKTEEDYKKNLGKDIEISLYKTIKGKKKLVGELVEYNSKDILINDIDLGKISIDKNIIAKANLAVKI